jgi:hypothetical protein
MRKSLTAFSPRNPGQQSVVSLAAEALVVRSAMRPAESVVRWEVVQEAPSMVAQAHGVPGPVVLEEVLQQEVLQQEVLQQEDPPVAQTAGR